MSDTNVIDHLLTKFGKQSRLAEAAGCAQSTISARRAVNSLRHVQMRNILTKAPEMGVEIAPDDFFPEIKAG